ncbi:hypothetical protein [methanotrophic endosymbiont of Bathymodiolus puteoserpentis (Logatchev)]|uniref:hypothetical protein n=1 Tax=methanotrophic endosymbiont of Bathymodiolus puteoserpentis (Logatchev) TaxID=343235 RepID=UPI00157A9FFD|nr:hypothetical protein [methanotrophic endosymbiont of Bathymodiolus puteoserpentis (Logatchev)]
MNYLRIYPLMRQNRYNLMRVFEEISKIQQPELIHPSNKKYNDTLEKRQQLVQKQDCAGSRYFCENLFGASQPKQAAKT